jgi:hypothetical protein
MNTPFGACAISGCAAPVKKQLLQLRRFVPPVRFELTSLRLKDGCYRPLCDKGMKLVRGPCRSRTGDLLHAMQALYQAKDPNIRVRLLTGAHGLCVDESQTTLP